MISGLPDSRANLDLGLEGPLLVVAGRVVAVVVEAGLADRAAVRVLRELAQLSRDGVVVAGRLVGMAADRGEDLGIRAGGVQRVAARLGVHPDREDAREAGLPGLGHELRLGGGPAVEVGVAVVHSGLGNSGGSFRTACPPGWAPNSVIAVSGAPSASSSLVVDSGM